MMKLRIRSPLPAAFVLDVTALAGVGVSAAGADPLSTISQAEPSASPAPTADPFLTPPAHWQGKRPGSVLKSHSVAVSNYPLPAGTQAWQVLYRTTDQHDKPLATVSARLRLGSDSPQGIVSHQFAEDASSTTCAPSAVVTPTTPATASTDSIAISALLNSGFAVSLPDYEGPDSEFAAPRQPGYEVLDGVRAAENVPQLGLRGSRTPTGAWGYSGGALASGWAPEVQPGYAPELNLKGVALGGHVNDIKATFLTAHKECR